MQNEEILTRFNEVQDEILKIGWVGILDIYHPDTNTHPENFKLFALYKEILENMKQRITLEDNVLHSALINKLNRLQLDILNIGMDRLARKHLNGISDVYNLYVTTYDSMRRRLKVNTDTKEGT